MYVVYSAGLGGEGLERTGYRVCACVCVCKSRAQASSVCRWGRGEVFVGRRCTDVVSLGSINRIEFLPIHTHTQTIHVTVDVPRCVRGEGFSL